VDLAVSLDVVNAANATSGGQRPCSAGDRNSAAAEAVLASRGIDQHYIAWIGLVLKAEARHGRCEAAVSRVARSVRSRADDSCGAHGEWKARCHNLVVLVLADDGDARQLSDAVTVKLTGALVAIGHEAAGAVVTLAGQVTTGGVLSVTVTLNVQPGPAVLVQVTVVAPTGKQLPEAGLQDTVPQLPPVAGAG